MAAPNTNPRFIDTGVLDSTEISTANTNLDGTGTVVTVLTAGAQGTLVDLIRIKAEVTTTAGMIRLFLHDGVAFFLYKELIVSAITIAADTPAYEVEFIPTTPLILPTGWTLRASTENAETFNVIVSGGDY